MRVSEQLREKRLRDNPSPKDDKVDVQRARSFNRTLPSGKQPNAGFRMMLPEERAKSKDADFRKNYLNGK